MQKLESGNHVLVLYLYFLQLYKISSSLRNSNTLYSAVDTASKSRRANTKTGIW